MKRLVIIAGSALALAGCNDGRQASTRHLQPIPPATMALMSSKGMSKNDPILVRAYKKESELEVWKRGADGEYALLKTYPICRWSGQLGPKTREGDRQAPEGFYTITPAQMNPNSSFYLSFDTGYPNAFDRAHGRTGAHLMVHGNCSSSGCYAMTDEAIAEVYAIARDAFAGGQRGFQFQALPFRMTAENLAKHRADPNMAFWKNLKEGSDHFEALKDEPKVAVCGGRYSFGDGSCAPPIPQVVAEKRRLDEQKVAELVAKGTPAVKVVYSDGGQHASFQQVLAGNASAGDGNFAILNSRRDLGTVSRPEALAEGPREIPIEAKDKKPATALALAKSLSKTAPAKKPDVAETVVAAGSPVADAPISASPSGPRAVYDRMVGNVFGSKRPAQTEAAAEPSVEPTRTAAILPPTKPAPAATAKPVPAAPLFAKSVPTSAGPESGPKTATAPAPPRRATSAASDKAKAEQTDAAPVIRGAQPVLAGGLQSSN